MEQVMPTNDTEPISYFQKFTYFGLMPLGISLIIAAIGSIAYLFIDTGPGGAGNDTSGVVMVVLAFILLVIGLPLFFLGRRQRSRMVNLPKTILYINLVIWLFTLSEFFWTKGDSGDILLLASIIAALVISFIDILFLPKASA
jgi:hypothetical protein